MVILKGYEPTTPERAGFTIQFTGTLWVLPASQFLYDVNITAVDGTIITGTTALGNIEKTPVNLTQVTLVGEDYDTTSNSLRFRVYNNLSYDLNYKYFIRFRYYLDL